MSEEENKVTIEGRTLYCPDGGPVALTCSETEAEDYQWYQRIYGEKDRHPIPGANEAQLIIPLNLARGNYYSVHFNNDHQQIWSEEVQVDELTFAGLVVETSGVYTHDGASIIIKNDGYVDLSLMLPYTTNITWYKDEKPIKGQNDITLRVTESGSFTVRASPEECSNYLQYLGTAVIVRKL
ncbi:hypothetical protein [Gilvibacter sp.]|uniref:hypothetical protein n=1 Tax=Gilvibacter sp. TaxID=2729997 RepID=UPI003F4A74F7